MHHDFTMHLKLSVFIFLISHGKISGTFDFLGSTMYIASKGDYPILQVGDLAGVSLVTTLVGDM